MVHHAHIDAALIIKNPAFRGQRRRRQCVRVDNAHAIKGRQRLPHRFVQEPIQFDIGDIAAHLCHLQNTGSIGLLCPGERRHGGDAGDGNTEAEGKYGG